MYDGESLQITKLIIDSTDSEETLEDAEESQLKMKDKMIQLDYEKLNDLYDTFVPQKEIPIEQNYFSTPSTSVVSSESSIEMSDLPSKKMPNENKLLQLFVKLNNAITALQSNNDLTLLKDRSRSVCYDDQDMLCQFYKNKAEAIATACFTQNRSLVYTWYNKTLYELIKGRKPNVQYFYVFGSLCYPTNDRDELGKMKPKAEIGIFIGYSESTRGFRMICSNFQDSLKDSNAILSKEDVDNLFGLLYEEYNATRSQEVLKEYIELTPAEAIQADCDIKAINIILQGLPTKIYALVSQHRVAKDLWEKIKLLMQGTSLTKQERECKLYDEFDKFTYKKGESLMEYYEGRQNYLCCWYNEKYSWSKWKQHREITGLSSVTITKGRVIYQVVYSHEKRDETWFMDKVLLVQTQQVVKVLTEEENRILGRSGPPDTSTSPDECSDALTETETEITSDSNIIPYSQRLSETQQETIQNSNSSAQQDALILSMNGTVKVNGSASVQNSKKHDNSDYVCINGDDCMSSDNLCVSNSMNDVKFRAKPKKRKSKKEIWKPTGKVFTKMGYIWRPTGRTFTIVVQIVLWYLDSGCSKHMTGDRSQLTNFISKFLGTVKFGNDQVAKIMGYGDYQIGNVTISRVYYVEGLGHNLFSVG
ncbi:retrovirus-related pol polyprotein from transposon TNT 1-94 [Tanacetum coccineum]